MLQERWPPWKAGLYGSEVVSPRGHCFRTGGLVYDTAPLLVVLVTYFGMGLGDLVGRKLLEGDEVCHC